MEVIIRDKRKNEQLNKKRTIKKNETVADNKKEMALKQQKLDNAKIKLVEQEYQNNLKEKLEDGLYDLINKLNHVDSSLSTIELRNLLSRKTVIGVPPKYSNTELGILFDYYKQYIEQINKIQTFLPTKKNFCSFAGISSYTYDNYMQSDDTERREIMQMIDDYITDINLTSAQNGEIKEVTTIFRSKAEHGLVEATAPVVIEHKSETNMDTILKQIQAVNQGKSLKTIELHQDKDGIYREGDTNEN